MRLVVAVALAFALQGCAWLNDDQGFIRKTADDYIDARASKPLIIPEDLHGARIQDAWPIPQIEERPLAKHFPGRAPRPDPIFGADAENAVVIQKLGSRRWLVVSGTPPTIWPVVKQFLADNGVTVGFEAPEDGRIDASWLPVEDRDYRDVIRLAIAEGKKEHDAVGGNDRIRFKIEQGIRRGSSEVHVRHENDALAEPTAEWPASSVFDTIEEKLLNEFGAYYGAGVAAESVSMVALDISAGTKAAIERDAQGYPQLRLNVDFDRAWAVVGQALRRANMEVKELERENGVFHVDIDKSVLTGEKGHSFLCRLWPGCSGGNVRSVDIRIASVGDAQLVSVLEREGGPVPQDISQQILVMLREFAS